MAEIINIIDNPETVKIFLQANDDLANLLWLGDFAEASAYVRKFYESHRLTIKASTEISKEVVSKRKEIYANAEERVLKEIEVSTANDVVKLRANSIFDKQFSEYISDFSSEKISLFALAPICRRINKIHRKLSNYQLPDFQQELFQEERPNSEILENFSRYTISYLDKDENHLLIKANTLDGSVIDIDGFIEELLFLLSSPTSDVRVGGFNKKEFPLWYRFFSKEGYLEIVFYSKKRFTINATFLNQNNTKKFLKNILRILDRY